jgi:hypothetical protein
LLAELAKLTGGIFTPVVHAHELQSVFEQVTFAEMELLRVTNLTLGKQAEHLVHHADGNFFALLELAPGANRLEIHGRARGGAEHTLTLPVHFARDGEPTPLAPSLVGPRTRLLENHLGVLRERNLAMEAERDARLRRELELRIQQERARARQLSIEPAAPSAR